jgi:hypothetical protein
MAEPCQNGFKCVWSKNAGTALTCALPRCQMYVGPSVAVDKLAKRVAHNTTNTVDAYRG